MVDLGTKIGKIVEGLLEDESMFLVEIQIKGNSSQPRINIKIDGDRGVSIQTCADISRKLGLEIEAEELISTRYNLEVSSPGLDQPLRLLRQYRKNIGRGVRVELKNGSGLKGELLEVNEKNIRINSEKTGKNKKQQVFEELEIAFDEIKLTNIIISFK